MLPENRLKNRTPDILPYEANRVFLPIIRGLNGSDYINASFIDGYRKKRAYISAQTPLPNTTDDFWRLIWEHNSPIIVLMQTETVARPTNTSATGLPVQSDSYWPMERSTRYQHLLVEPMVEYTMPHFILREFRLTDTRDGQSRTLRQFQLLGWPQDSVVPKSAEAMIDLIGQVHKTQSQFGQDGPITVHCSTGSGRSAVFICLSLLLERMRCEGMVDIFITTRMLRTQRVDMIQTPDQYAFCYAATLEYLASFDHYTS
ncbi:Receptor-type tyrosine-protein phosphatase delta [Clonorchis sinensis]|nr:Receptor-type tyrosine-protein phosphatase delta [Clonorchis sinensis]